MVNSKQHFRSGGGDTTKIGYVNTNNQHCCGTLDISGNDYLQYAYKIECGKCGYVYGANGSDVFQRKCPECGGGKSGIPYWKKLK